MNSRFRAKLKNYGNLWLTECARQEEFAMPETERGEARNAGDSLAMAVPVVIRCRLFRFAQGDAELIDWEQIRV